MADDAEVPPAIADGAPAPETEAIVEEPAVEPAETPEPEPNEPAEEEPAAEVPAEEAAEERGLAAAGAADGQEVEAEDAAVADEDAEPAADGEADGEAGEGEAGEGEAAEGEGEGEAGEDGVSKAGDDAEAAGEESEAAAAGEPVAAGEEELSVEKLGAASRIAAVRRGQLSRRGLPVSDPALDAARPIPATDEEGEGEGEGGKEGEGEGEDEFNEDEAYIEVGEDFDEVAAFAEEDEEAARLSDAWKVEQSRRAALSEANAELQRKLADYLRSVKKTDHRSQAETSVIDQEARYMKCLGQLVELRDEHRRLEGMYDVISAETRQRLKEKVAKAMEIREAFLEFKREIFRGSENSRTGKPIPAKLIANFEEQEALKDTEVERMRLGNILRRNVLRKLELTLKQKENLAEGLHLIDFEQLKIENQTLNEKIEERNEELLKLRKKTTATVQVRRAWASSAAGPS